MRWITRLLLIPELLIGVAPVTALYVTMFPAGLSWIQNALRLALRGRPNAFTLGIAAAVVFGGLGLASLWFAAAARLFGRRLKSRLVLAGILLGMATSVFLLTVAIVLGAFWTDYFLYGTPVLVALHQVLTLVRK